MQGTIYSFRLEIIVISVCENCLIEGFWSIKNIKMDYLRILCKNITQKRGLFIY